METEKLMEQAVEFHGHSCPGLAIGVAAAKYVLDQGAEFSVDEEFVAIVENNNCSVDGLQALLGTTSGKGNLISRDSGKNSFTFFNRRKKRAIRLAPKENLFANQEFSREEMIDYLLNSKTEDIFQIKQVPIPIPHYAEIGESVICYDCGEPTMDTRFLEHQGVQLCIPCYEEEVGK